MSKRFPVLWLTGNTGAGKTTLAKAMKEEFPDLIINLDGDEMRATISREEGFSKEDRAKHNRRVARLAHLLSEQGFLVIVSVIAPFASVREELSEICDPVWIYVKRDGLDAPDRPYEAPIQPDLVIDNDAVSIEEGREKLLHWLCETHHLMGRRLQDRPEACQAA